MSQGYTTELLVEKLSKLSNTQHSVQTLSHWILYHKQKHKEFVNTWNHEFYKQKTAERKLTFLYLANDIIQNSRKKNPEYLHEFSKILIDVILNIQKEGSPQVINSVTRLIKIWEERDVLSNSLIQDIKKALNITSGATQSQSTITNTSPSSKTSANNSNNIVNASTSSVVPQSLKPIIDLMSEINEATQLNSQLEESFNHIPNDIFSSIESGDLKLSSHSDAEVVNSLRVLETYKQHLEHDIRNRAKLVELLIHATETQDELRTHSTSKLQQCLTMLKEGEPFREKINMNMDYTSPSKRPLSDDDEDENDETSLRTSKKFKSSSLNHHNMNNNNSEMSIMNNNNLPPFISSPPTSISPSLLPGIGNNDMFSVIRSSPSPSIIPNIDPSLQQ